MDMKKYIIYIFIIITGIFAIFCIGVIFFTCITINVKTIFASLFMGSITCIGILINIKHNSNLMKYNNELLDENLNSRFLQLRYHESKRAINTLKKELQITLLVYDYIKKYVENKDIGIKCLSAHAFLVMQFVNLISNYELLNDLPITIKGNFEKKFEKKVSTNPVYTPSLEYLEIIDKSPTLDIQDIPFPYYIEYKQSIDKFKESNQIIQNKHVFSCYFESDNISEEDLFNHFNQVLNDLSNNTIEDLILRDRDVEILKEDFKIL